MGFTSSGVFGARLGSFGVPGAALELSNDGATGKLGRGTAPVRRAWIADRFLGTPKIYTTTGFGLTKIGEWLVWTIWCICKLLSNTILSIYTNPG